MLLIAYSMLQVALVSDHFMLRYVALEFVGLCITAAALLLTSPREKRWNNTKQVFINLRIGDLALLVAIFLMFTISESFEIAKNFDDALLGSIDIQMILSACLFDRDLGKNGHLAAKPMAQCCWNQSGAAPAFGCWIFVLLYWGLICFTGACLYLKISKFPYFRRY